jgi:hypothetical protein
VNKKGVYNERDDKIGIRKIFEDLKKDSECKIKFCTFACIRPSATFADDSIATLKFAEAVNSCAGLIVNPAGPLPDDSVSALPAALAPDEDDEADTESSPEVKSTSRAIRQRTSQELNDSKAFTRTGLTSARAGGGSLRKDKRAIHKSTLKAKAKSNPAHTHQKKKSTRKNKKNSSRNKNKSTIKNRN